MKIHDLSAQQIIQSKWYRTYECITELVVTVPAARSTIVEMIKPLVYLHIFTNITTVQHEFIRCSWASAASVKIAWHYHHFTDSSWLSTTFASFHDFPGLDNGLPKFHDFPWPGGTLWSIDIVEKHQRQMGLTNAHRHTDRHIITSHIRLIEVDIRNGTQMITNFTTLARLCYRVWNRLK